MVFTRVTRLVKSKGLWRDLLVLDLLDRRLHERGIDALFIGLSTDTGRRSAEEREVLNYLAHLLALFARAERLHQIQPGEPSRFDYLVDLVLESAQSVGERQFLVHSHIGNYALFIAGLRAEWVAHRQKYRRRPVSLDYYCDTGRSFYRSAAGHDLAERFSLRRVFQQLSDRFDYYRQGLERLGRQHLFAGAH